MGEGVRLCRVDCNFFDSELLFHAFGHWKFHGNFIPNISTREQRRKLFSLSTFYLLADKFWKTVRPVFWIKMHNALFFKPLSRTKTMILRDRTYKEVCRNCSRHVATDTFACAQPRVCVSLWSLLITDSEGNSENYYIILDRILSPHACLGLLEKFA